MAGTQLSQGPLEGLPPPRPPALLFWAPLEYSYIKDALTDVFSVNVGLPVVSTSPMSWRPTSLASFSHRVGLAIFDPAMLGVFVLKAARMAFLRPSHSWRP